jgi:hypothetical protein
LERATRRLFGGLLLALLGTALVVMRAERDSAASGLSAAVATGPVAGLSPVTLERGGEFQRGVALGLYWREPWRDYAEPLREIAALGADTVSLVVTWAQEHTRSIEIGRDEEETRPDGVVVDAIADAHAAGLRVMLFPILKVRTRGPGEWRGTIAPEDVEAWFESYTAFLLHYARLAEAQGVAAFSVGSELGSMERYEGHWRAALARVREVFSGEVLYSANWDHYHRTPFWDAVDRIGLTAYYELTGSLEARPDTAALAKAWAPIQAELVRFSRAQGRPFLFTEVGYYSQAGTAWHPWDYTRTGAVDLEAQLLCYRAFYEVWRDVPELTGVFFWHWWGEGGPEDGSYNPRGKPAEEVIRFWFGQPAGTGRL